MGPAAAKTVGTLCFGARGTQVAVLQARLNFKSRWGLAPLSVDGLFGPKTLARVKEFQKNNGLKMDGIVGPLTWGKLLEGPTIPKQACLYCDNISHLHLSSVSGIASTLPPAPSSSPALSLASFPGSASLPSLGSLASFVPKLRPLRGAPEESIATSTYGGSIDTSTVSLSDKTGLGGRAFVVGIPMPIGRPRQIMNVGPSPSHDTMVHELAHVWQSQHASSAVQFMKNAVESQALAEATNLITSSKSFSAYGYRPGRPFGDYGAEQIAQQAERGEAAILSHMKGVAAWVVDADNETSLKTPRIEDTSSPGVKT